MADTIESQLKKYRACLAVIDRCASDTDCRTCELYIPDAQVILFAELERLVEGNNA